LTREPQVGDLETMGRCSRRWWVMCTCWGGGDFVFKRKFWARPWLVKRTCCNLFTVVYVGWYFNPKVFSSDL